MGADAAAVGADPLSALALADELLGAPDVAALGALALGAVADATHRRLLGFYLLDADGARARRVASANVSQRFLRRYERRGITRDPIVDVAVRRGVVTRRHDVMSLGQWRATEHYRGVAVLHRFGEVVIAPVVVGGRVAATLHVGDPEGAPPITGGEVAVVRAIAGAVGLALGQRRRQEACAPALAALTPRERDVALLVAEDRGDAEIAARLQLSPHTVGQHLKSVYRKLGVRSRVGLTRRVLLGDGGSGAECPDRGIAAPEPRP